MLKKRFSNILGSSKKKGTALFALTGAVVLVVTLMVGFNFASASALSDNQPVSEPVQPKATWDNLLSTKENLNALNVSNTEKMTYYTIDELSAIVYDKAKPVERQFDNAKALKLNVTTENVKVTYGGDKLIVRYPEWYDGEYTVTEKDGTITLKRENNNRYLKKGNGYNGEWLQEVLKYKGITTDIVVEVVIPKSFDSLSISNVAGKLDITDCVLKTLALSTVSSNVTVKGGQVNALNISAVSSKTKFQGCAFTVLNSSDVSGKTDIELTGKASDYDISFTEVSGDLNVNGADVKSARNKSAEKKININSVSGSFTVTDAK